MKVVHKVTFCCVLPFLHFWHCPAPTPSSDIHGVAFESPQSVSQPTWHLSEPVDGVYDLVMVSTISRPSEGELRSAAAYIVEIEGGSRDPLLVSARQESVWKTRLVPQMGRTRLVNQKSFGELRLWHGRVDYAFRTQYGTGRLVFTRRYLANDVLITVWENYSDSADDVGAPRRTVTLEDAPGAGHGKYLSGAHYVLVDTIRSTNFIISEIVKSQLGSTGTTSSWSEWASSDNESVWKRLRKELAKEHLGPNNSAGCRWGGLRVVIDRDSDGKASAITEEWLDEAGGVLTA
ncbi:MAG: hypothetical protein DRQ65_06035, partial [Gammaproteobacteria bacterium]